MDLSRSFSLKPCLRWQICLKINFSSDSLIFAVSIYFLNNFIGRRADCSFDKCIQPSRYTSVLLFSIKIDIWVSFKIISEFFNLMISKKLKNPTKLRTHKNIVLRFIKFILSSPNDLYDVWSSCGVKGIFFLGVWQQILLMPSKT